LFHLKLAGGDSGGRVMGRIYREQLKSKIYEIGATRLCAYVNPEGFETEYLQHIYETLQEFGVTVTADRQQANFILEGKAEPEFCEDQVTAYFETGQKVMLFSGAVA
jgi:bifunctional pyridoxal-dependent enzyme with beta-cystathionase and maltose regulon repressor activities